MEGNFFVREDTAATRPTRRKAADAVSCRGTILSLTFLLFPSPLPNSEFLASTRAACLTLWQIFCDCGHADDSFGFLVPLINLLPASPVPHRPPRAPAQRELPFSIIFALGPH